MSQHYLNDKGDWVTRVGGEISVGESLAIVPVDIQSRLATTIQTHNAVSIPLSGNSVGAWIDCDGFTDIAITLLTDLGTAQNSCILRFSNDGTTVHGSQEILPAGTSTTLNTRSGYTQTRARYCQVVVYNNDSALAHTMSAWAYLKA